MAKRNVPQILVPGPRALKGITIDIYLFGLISLHAWGGTQNAIVTGSVYARSSGDLVPGAAVHLINAGTGFSQMQTTGSDGTYTFNNVPPAENYVISVEKSGLSRQFSPISPCR